MVEETKDTQVSNKSTQRGPVVDIEQFLKVKLSATAPAQTSPP